MTWLKSDTQSKADNLNEQFKSVFTKDGKSRTSDKGPSRYKIMPDIQFQLSMSCQTVESFKFWRNQTNSLIRTAIQNRLPKIKTAHIYGSTLKS